WPAGKSTVTPRRSRSATVASPTSGKNRSPRQVIMSDALTGDVVTAPPATRSVPMGWRRPAVRRRRRHHDEDQQRIGPVVHESVLDAGARDQRVATSERLLLLAEREAPGSLDDVVDLVLVVVPVGLLGLAGRDAVEVELRALGRGQRDLRHLVGRELR